MSIDYYKIDFGNGKVVVDADKARDMIECGMGLTHHLLKANSASAIATAPATEFGKYKGKVESLKNTAGTMWEAEVGRLMNLGYSQRAERLNLVGEPASGPAFGNFLTLDEAFLISAAAKVPLTTLSKAKVGLKDRKIKQYTKAKMLTL